MYKFNMPAPFQRSGDFAKHNDCSVNLWSADRLFILTTKTEERYIKGKGTLHSHLLKKTFFYLHLILIYWSMRFDSRNTYHVTSVTGYGFN